MALPDCDTLFTRYFGPWYDEPARKRRGYAATRPDVEELDAAIGKSASDLSPLSTESQADAAERIQDMFSAAVEDWKPLLGVKGPPSLDWLERFDRHFQSREIERTIHRSDATKYDNEYLVTCCELGAVIGTVLRELEPQLEWLLEWPYWDSALYDTKTGRRIHVFSWAVKKMSSYGVDDGLVAKIGACRKLTSS